MPSHCCQTSSGAPGMQKQRVRRKMHNNRPEFPEVRKITSFYTIVALLIFNILLVTAQAKIRIVS
jgi:hypothetical protein